MIAARRALATAVMVVALVAPPYRAADTTVTGSTGRPDTETEVVGDHPLRREAYSRDLRCGAVNDLGPFIAPHCRYYRGVLL